MKKQKLICDLCSDNITGHKMVVRTKDREQNITIDEGCYLMLKKKGQIEQLCQGSYEKIA